MGTNWFTVWCVLFINVQASPVGPAKDQVCSPGFESKIIFKVTENHLRQGTVLGKVNVSDCTDDTEFVFTTNDDHFMAQTDGTLMVKKRVVLKDGQRDFIINSWDSQGQKMTISIVVQYQGDHEAVHHLQNNVPLKDFTNNLEVPILLFPSSNEGLKRKKREWILPPISVLENHKGPYPLFVARVVSDSATIKKGHYRLSGPGADQPPVGLFTMDRVTGRLYVTEALDREKKDRYLLRVHAELEGSGLADDPMDIVVRIIDENDNKPIFTFLGNVAESSATGSEVIKVKATDADEPHTDNSDIFYRIISQEPQQPSPSMFSINPGTGVIRVNAPGLDRQKYPQYTLMVQAADNMGEGLSELAKVILTVTDINVNAPGTSLPEPIQHSSISDKGMSKRVRESVIPPINVPENSRGPFPMEIAQFRSDKMKKVFYRISGPGADQPPVGIFYIHRESGELCITEGLDRERQEKYILQVHVTEERGAEASEPVEIVVNVIDQNDNKPVFKRDTFVGEVPQSSSRGFLAIKVEATDADEPNTDNSDISYRIVSQDPGEPSPSMFAINPKTGEIRVSVAELDREKYPKYTLMVEAADNMGEGLSGLAKVILTVTDTNVNAPVTSLPAAGVGRRRRRNAYSDHYSNIREPSSEDMLPNFLPLLEPIPHSSKADKGMRRRKRGWVIPPLSVPENSRGPFPMQLAQIRSDGNKGKKVFYRISGPGADLPPVGIFTIDRESGWLYVTEALDRERQEKYMLQVHATEDGGTEASEPIEIVVNVIDQNDNKPVFNTDTFVGEVPQSSPTGFLVIKVEATDADDPNTDNSDISYQIVSQDPGEPSPFMFTINPKTGEIRVNVTELDIEKHPRYELTVEAADMQGEGLTGTAKVVLTVTDHLINAPTDAPSVTIPQPGWIIPDINLSENSRGPYPMMLAQVRFDEDGIKKIIYSISGLGADQPPVGLFTMDPDTGYLYVTEGVDREKQNKYTLQVHAVAKDEGTALGQTQVVIKVVDQNDNRPVFSRDAYEGEVLESSSKGFEVIRVEATDTDEPNTPNSEIRYSIISQQPSPSMFVINPVSGAITLNADGLNREKHPQYNLQVQAADSAREGLTAHVQVILTVTANSATVSQSK